MKNIVYKIVKYTLKPLYLLIYHPKVIGKENIPDEGAVIIAGNHISNLDAATMLNAPKRVVHTLAKCEIFKSKIGSMFFRSMGCISVDRKEHKDNAKSEAIDVLNSGGIIGIFPEGTVNNTKEIVLPFKFGAVSFASKTNAKIVPFAITGKYRMFGKSIKVIYGKAYNVSSDLEKENDILRNKIIDLIRKANNEKE